MRYGRVFAFLPAGLLVGGAAFQAEIGQGGDFASDGHFLVRGFGNIEVAAVCTFTEKEIPCRDLQGRPMPNITKKLEDFYSGKNTRQFGQSLSYLFRRKNRIVVFQVSGASKTGVRIQGVQASSATSNYRGFFEDETPDGSRWLWLPVDADQGSRESSIAFRFNEPVGKPISLPARSGSEGQIDSVRIQIESLRKAPDKSLPVGFWNRTGVIFKYIGNDPANPFIFEISPYGKDGKPLIMADSEGRPTGPNQKGLWRFVETDGPRFFLPTSDKQIWPTEFDPKYIESFRISAYRTHFVTFDHIPLDPK